MCYTWDQHIINMLYDTIVSESSVLFLILYDCVTIAMIYMTNNDDEWQLWQSYVVSHYNSDPKF